MANLEKHGRQWVVRIPAVDGAAVEFDRALDDWPHIVVDMDEPLARQWLRSIVWSAAGKRLLADPDEEAGHD